jgi:isoleucyl-tRNA synthetase
MKVTKPPKGVHFPDIEREIADLWDAEKTFQASIDQRPADRKYRFYDGPPFATGLPHFGHFVPNAIKDAFPRYFTMKNHRVERRFGWDCHGLPIEMLIQKELGLNGKPEIEAYGIAKFNAACRESVLRYSQEWRTYMRRLGRWVDNDNEYRTMDRDFMESVWYVFKSLWDKGLIYRGFKVMSYSTALGSSLSNFEAGLDYRDVQDPSVTLLANLTGSFSGRSLLVWTTTPWTMPANLAIAVDPSGNYAEVLDHRSNRLVILLESRLAAYFKHPDDYTVHRTFAGSQLEGIRYEPFYQHHSLKEHPSADKLYRVYGTDYVLHDTGSGAVHAAPAFGEDDHKLATSVGLPIFDHLDSGGHFLDDMPKGVRGIGFKDADKIICHDLKERGLMYRHETFVHSYPFCYRSGTPLMYRALPSWFVSVETIKERLMANNTLIQWVPEHIRDGRFGRWLENARDWNVGRARYWGNPIPIWENLETQEIVCLGSIEDLQQATGQTITDLHIEHLENVTIPSKKGGAPLKRTPFVMDCWFESGSMPYAQQHYPFENVEKFESEFPADFICEGLDQTRGWFYTLNVLATALFDKPAFKNVVVNGLILASDGKKMSKSLKNYPDPMATLDEFGADSVRLYLLNSPATFGDEVRFSIDGVKENTRRVLLPLWNAYSFFATYASIDGFDPDQTRPASSDEHDQWILLKLNELIKNLDQTMMSYQIARACPAIVTFLDDLNNWYIRRNRRRFWNADLDAHNTLFTVLAGVCQVLAPFAPFAADYFWRKLSFTKAMQLTKSVHLSLLPDARSLSLAEQEILARVDLARRVVELGRTIRVNHRIKIRQPLSDLTVGVVSDRDKARIESMQDTIAEELNVKKISVTLDPGSLATVVLKPQFKVLGKRLGPAIKDLQAALASPSHEQQTAALEGQPLVVGSWTLSPEEYVVELRASGDRLVATDRELVASLDPTITEELRLEGLARELVSLVQKARKNAGYDVEDRIQLLVKASPLMATAIRSSQGYIEEETLAEFVEAIPRDHHKETVQIESESVDLVLARVHQS